MLPVLPIPMIGALILGFLCASMIAAQKRVSGMAALIGLCALQSALIALVWHYDIQGLRMALPIFASCIPPLAWINLTRVGVDPSSNEIKHLCVPIAAVLAVIFQPYALDILIPLLYLGYGAAILTLLSRGADALPCLRLESGDPSGRIWRWIGAALILSGLCDVAIIAAIISGMAHIQPWIIVLGSSGILLLVGALSLSRDLSDVPDPAGEGEENLDPKPQANEEDAAIIARLDALMEEGQLHLDPDLTLSRLARRLGLPVKTLSTAINKVTGENVSRYINARRIRAACAALEAGETVTSAMLSAGFNTKSNFNREFLRITGQTPRAFRG
ncbi:AraC family transcriptional regulator [Planktotalea sp.]|uniref:helix-turn-helix domain-containing protein n=1 Tax=Planktotalea sp. TaxID=2029877 RepID=UPI003296B3B7